MRPKVWVGRMETPLRASLSKALDWLQWSDLVPRDARVTIKPNLTYPFYKPGVTTSPRLIDALVGHLATRTRYITIVESDGGSYAWPAKDAFKGHGIDQICALYGARAINLTEYPREWAEVEVLGRRIKLEMSKLLISETDIFITMPVPKVHAMTQVSLGFKNQWGCLPDVKRLHNHPDFPHTVLAINKLLRPKLAVFDGTYFLNRNGPMEGDPAKMGLLIASDDVGAGSLACCELMQINPRSVAHFCLAMRAGMMPFDLEEIVLNTELTQFQGPKFYLQRNWIQWVTLAVFHNKLATRIAYDSPLAKPLHDILYFFRGRPKDFSPRW